MEDDLNVVYDRKIQEEMGKHKLKPVTFKHFFQPLRSHTQSFGILQQLFENTPLCPPTYSIVRGVEGVPELFFWLES